MNCPKCEKEMIITSQDVSNNSKNGQEYDRTIYWCEKDDIWVNVEIPKGESRDGDSTVIAA